MINNISNTINHITLYTSESCNLSCKYCVMAQQNNKIKHFKESCRVKESFLNGQYLNTLKIAFKKLNIDPKQIKSVDLWGQEPTLTLNEFSIFFTEFYSLYPNIENLFFSTNGTNILPIINLIKSLDKIINKKFNLNIQISYDGVKNTKIQRGIEPTIIINNIKNLIINLNSITLQNLKINIFFHNVIDYTLIDYYTKEQVSEQEFLIYLSEFEDLTDSFKQLNKNLQVQINAFDAGLIHPFNASKEEGEKLALFYNKCEHIGKNLKYKFWRNSFYSVLINQCRYDFDTYNSILDKIYYYSDSNCLKKISHNGCGYNYYSLKIRYDGTLINCQSSTFGLGEECELEEKNLEYTTQKYRIKKKFYPNIITDDDETLSNYFYEVKLAQEESHILFYSQTVNLLLLLLEAGQIDESYKDFNKLLKHAYFISNWNLCSYNNMTETGSVIGRTLGHCRFGCNGFLDIIEKYFDQKFIEKDSQLWN